MVPELSSPSLISALQALQAIMMVSRSVAQPGSAPALGAGGPRFESLYSDHLYSSLIFPQNLQVTPISLRFEMMPLLVQALLGVVLLCR